MLLLIAMNFGAPCNGDCTVNHSTRITRHSDAMKYANIFHYCPSLNLQVVFCIISMLSVGSALNFVSSFEPKEKNNKLLC